MVYQFRSWISCHRSHLHNAFHSYHSQYHLLSLWLTSPSPSLKAYLPPDLPCSSPCLIARGQIHVPHPWLFAFPSGSLLETFSCDFFTSSPAAVTRFTMARKQFYLLSDLGFWRYAITTWCKCEHVLACLKEHNMLCSTTPPVVFCLQPVNGNNSLSQIQQRTSITIYFFSAVSILEQQMLFFFYFISTIVSPGLISTENTAVCSLSPLCSCYRTTAKGHRWLKCSVGKPSEVGKKKCIFLLSRCYLF